jgi:hypothetical protein
LIPYVRHSKRVAEDKDALTWAATNEHPPKGVFPGTCYHGIARTVSLVVQKYIIGLAQQAALCFLKNDKKIETYTTICHIQISRT